MSKLRDVAQQALYAMAMLIDPEKLEPWQIELYDKTVNALRTALAEQPAEQEPVGEVAEVAQGYDEGWTAIIETGLRKLQKGDKVYTAPQPKAAEQEPRPCHVFNVTKNGSLTEWEPTTMAFALPDGKHALYAAPQPAKRQQLTDEEICAALGIDGSDDWTFTVAYAAIAAYERKNGIGGQP